MKTHDLVASGPDVGTLVPLEGRLVPYMGPEWMAHLRAEGRAYAELAGAVLPSIPTTSRQEGR